jgi:hypothetical protein
MFVEVANDWNSLDNVLSHAWDVGEEEEGENTSCSAEVACCFAARWVVSLLPSVPVCNGYSMEVA